MPDNHWYDTKSRETYNEQIENNKRLFYILNVLSMREYDNYNEIVLI